MENQINNRMVSVFEQIKHTDENGNVFWSARELSKVLEYSEYRHFLPVIERAKEACYNSRQKLADHFEDILEMITTGKTAQREVELCHFSKPWLYGLVWKTGCKSNSREKGANRYWITWVVPN